METWVGCIGSACYPTDPMSAAPKPQNQLPDRPVTATQILENQGQTMLHLPSVQLVVDMGPDKGRACAIETLSLRIGTAPGNELVLTDPAVSAYHCEIVFGEQGALLRNLRSTNGTYVDGARIESVYLDGTAEIRVGNTVLTFLVTAETKEFSLTRRTTFGDMLGHSVPMRLAFSVLERAAKSDITLLIGGESGTGKELAAQAVHESSQRAGQEYVVFDCAAASPTLIEAQLFGHLRGAFTGATEDRAGAFEEADGGTLVLDEIGELPLSLQPKLLRAIESKTIRRVGSQVVQPIDFRLIACTNRNLREEVRIGNFREDLFYRLSVLEVKLPPLRDRKEEIPRLVRMFLNELGPNLRDVPKAFMELLLHHSWPGNVRELRNAIARFAVMPDIEPQTFCLGTPAGLSTTQLAENLTHLSYQEAKRRWDDQFEEQYFTQLLDRHDGNVSQACRAAKVSRQTYYRITEKYRSRE